MRDRYGSAVPTSPPVRPSRFDRLPAPALFVIVAVPLVVVGVGLRALDHRSDLLSLVLRGVLAVVLAAISTTRILAARKTFGGAEGLAALRSAIRTGDVPAGADTATWAPELRRRERALSRSRWLVPVLFGALAVFAVWAVVALPGTKAYIGWFVLVMAVGVGTWATVQGARLRPRVRRLLTRLEEDGR